MRISIKTGDRTDVPLAELLHSTEYHPYLDGIRQDLALMADEEEGVMECYYPTSVRTHLRYGKVEIRRPVDSRKWTGL